MMKILPHLCVKGPYPQGLFKKIQRKIEDNRKLFLSPQSTTMQSFDTD